MAVVAVGVALLHGGSASAKKQFACDLLTADEVAGTYGGVAQRPVGERDDVIDKEPFKGETHYRCNWPIGENAGGGNVYVMAMAVRTAAQRKAALEEQDNGGDELKAEGWAVEKQTMGEATCVVGTPPSSKKTVGMAVVCWTVAKGTGVKIASVLTSTKVTPAKVKALLDLATSRLP
jgi:hypothetical protein